jgi:hypothetical protein
MRENTANRPLVSYKVWLNILIVASLIYTLPLFLQQNEKQKKSDYFYIVRFLIVG